MAKYYLNVMLNDKTVLTITSGKLREIDDFIIKNNIQNAEQLYDLIKDDLKYSMKDDCVEFAIEYKHSGEIRSKRLMFKNDLLSFRGCHNRESYIYDLIEKDKYFKIKFDAKYINRLLRINKKTPITDIAREYISRLNRDTFGNIYNSLVSKRQESNTRGKYFENSEDFEDAQNQRKYSYSMQRDMYFDAYFYNKTIPTNKVIVKDNEKYDEFEELMLYGTNTFEGVKVDGIPYQEFVEIQDSNIDSYYDDKVTIDKIKPIKKKSKVKVKKLENINQLSMFNDK